MMCPKCKDTYGYIPHRCCDITVFRDKYDSDLKIFAPHTIEAVIYLLTIFRPKLNKDQLSKTTILLDHKFKTPEIELIDKLS